MMRSLGIVDCFAALAMTGGNAREDEGVGHCEEQSDVAIYDCGLLRYARNDGAACASLR